MTMFLEPLKSDTPDQTVLSELLLLVDAMQEFDCYCNFIHQAHEGIAARLELDQDSVDGISMSGRCLAARSAQIKQRVMEIAELARGESGLD